MLLEKVTEYSDSNLNPIEASRTDLEAPKVPSKVDFLLTVSDILKVSGPSIKKFLYRCKDSLYQPGPKSLT